MKKRHTEEEAGIFYVTRTTGVKVMGGESWFNVRRMFSTVKAQGLTKMP